MNDCSFSYENKTSPNRRITRNREFSHEVEEEQISMPQLPADVERKSIKERIKVHMICNNWGAGQNREQTSSKLCQNDSPGTINARA